MKKPPITFSFVLLISLIFIDQIVKWWIQARYPSLISANQGVIFGWLDNAFISYLLLTIGFLVLIWLLVKSNLSFIAYRISLIFIVAGALSNIIDRFLHGYVVDYLKFGFWPTFNLADVFIVLGIIVYGYKLMTTKT